MAPDSPPDSTADDDPDLRERVEQLEATVEAQQQTIQQLLPSRRRVLQAGGLLAGGGVLGALTADRASADVTGQVGTQQDRVDVFGGAVDANSVSTEQIGSERHYAGSYDGGDPDSRLDAALTAASDEDVIYLENATYNDAKTINKPVNIFGTGGNDGTTISANWTVGTTSMQSVALDSITLTVDDGQRFSNINMTNGAAITIDGPNQVIFIGLRGGSLTFGSSSFNCIIDASIDVSVTDNGSNTVGDIA